MRGFGDSELGQGATHDDVERAWGGSDVVECDRWLVGECDGEPEHVREQYDGPDLHLCDTCTERFDTCDECGCDAAFHIVDDTTLCADCVKTWVRRGELEANADWTIAALQKINGMTGDAA